MRMLATIGLAPWLVANVALADPPTTPNQDPRCVQSKDYSSHTTIIVFDRTTDWPIHDTERWKAAMRGIISDPDTYGQIVTLEVKDTPVSANLGPVLCLPRVAPQHADEFAAVAPPKLPAEYGMASRIANWLVETVNVIFPARAQFIGREHAISDADARLAMRVGVLRYLEELPAGSSSSESTALVDPLFGVITEHCTTSEVCSVFVFSDFEDTKLIRHLQGSGDAEGWATTTYARLARMYHPTLNRSVLRIVGWGIGRDQSDAGKALDDAKLRRLRGFWEAFLGEICHSGRSDSQLSLTLDFVGTHPQRCP